MTLELLVRAVLLGALCGVLFWAVYLVAWAGAKLARRVIIWREDRS